MVYLAVAIGGFLGACARYLLSELIGSLYGFPISTLVINWSGSFFLAWFYTITMERIPIHPHLRIGIGTGFVGAYTTFSSINIELWRLIANHDSWLSLLYFVATYGGGIVLSIGGYLLALRQSQLRTIESSQEDAL